MDIADALVDYLEAVTHLGENTQAGYRQRLSVFARWAATVGVPLEQVNNARVQAFLAWLKTSHKPHKAGKAELSTHTIAGYVRCIWALLYWCLEDEEHQQYVTLARVKGIKMPRITQVVKPTFSDAEIEALFAACQHEGKPHEYQLRDRAILSVLLDTGIRAAELRTLTIARVQLSRDASEDTYLTVMGKGRIMREIPLGNKARRALTRYIRQYRKGAAKGSPVFLSRQGDSLSYAALKDILARLLDVSTLPKDTQVNIHKFRHSFAARYMAQGGDLYDLSKLLGHKSIVVTEGYTQSLGAKAIRKRKEHTSVLDYIKEGL